MSNARILTLRKKEKDSAAVSQGFEPFERKNAVVPLYFLLVVVPEGQDKYVKDLLLNANPPAAMLFSHRASGTASSDLYEVLGLENNKKRTVVSLLRKDTYDDIAPKLSAKFRASEYSRGIAVLIKATSLYGLSAYKLFSHHPLPYAGEDTEKEKSSMDNSMEAIIAIVNDGYSDIVMSSAKAAGARGGTIMHARGSGSKEAETFYGIEVTPEKEMVLIIVDRAIRDSVLESIGKACGLLTKGQGICFSLPVSEAIGLAGGVEENGGEGNS